MPIIDREYLRLTDLPVPDFIPDQLAGITRDTAQVQTGLPFDPHVALGKLRDQEGSLVIGVDIGGGKLSSRLHRIRDGVLLPDNEIRGWDIVASDGEGFLGVLREAARYARYYHLPVGISTAGVVEGTTLLGSPNIPIFMEKFRLEYEADFDRLFDRVTVLNDGVAGAFAGTFEAVRRNIKTDSVIFSINGGGVGEAIFIGGCIWPTELGHVPVDDGLNLFQQHGRCTMNETGATCIEMVAGGRAGIEQIYKRFNNDGLWYDGRIISQKYQEGDDLARYLYALSAWGVAHTIVGLGNVFGILRPGDDASQTAIVGHGGVYKVPYYGARVHQIISNHLGYEPTFILTHEFSDNACELGAGIAAMVGI